MSMINPGQEIEEVLEAAVVLAQTYGHEYVTLEHLAYAIVNHEPFFKLINDYGVDATDVLEEFDEYLSQQTALVSKSEQKDELPRRTQALERAINRSLTHVLFTGRDSLQIIDVFLSIQMEQQSHASYFLIKHGLNKVAFVEYYNKHYAVLS